MSRSVSWRRLRNAAVEARIDEALQSIMYIVNQTGPTGFVIKQERVDKKITVLLGDPHMCTCSVFRKEKELCVHIVWLLLKKFRIPKENSIVHQLGLVEREVNAVLRGHVTKTSIGAQQEVKQDDSSSSPSNDSGSCGQRPVSPSDVCPICQDKMMESMQRLTYCKHSCGKTVHLKCMKVWADHQKSQGKEIIECPLCRGTFCTYIELNSELHSRARPKTKEFTHDGTTCSNCQMSPITGKCFKCTSCMNTFLCNTCFKNNAHSLHNFDFKQHANNHWRAAAVRSLSNSSLPPTVITDLQQREITSDDYELLLQLDCPPSAIPRRALRPHVISSLPTEPLDHNNPLILGGFDCHLCSEMFARGDWICKLPCGHKIHRTCINTWFTTEGYICPIDGRDVDTDEREGRSRRNKTSQQGNLRPNRTNVPSRRAVSPTSLIVSGHNMGMPDHNDSLPSLRQFNGIPQRLSIHSRINNHLPGIATGLSLQATLLHQGTSGGNSDLILPNIEPKSNRGRVLSSIRRSTLRATSQLAPADSLSLQATSILHSEPADDNGDFTPKLELDGSKVPHKTRSHRLTAIHGRKTSPLTTFDNFYLQATSVLHGVTDKKDPTLPELKLKPDTASCKGRTLAGHLQRTPNAHHRKTSQLVAVHDLNLQATSILPCEHAENVVALTRKTSTTSIQGRRQ